MSSPNRFGHLIRASPYRPAACEWPHLKGLTQVRTRSHVQKFKVFLAKRLTSTQGRLERAKRVVRLLREEIEQRKPDFLAGFLDPEWIYFGDTRALLLSSV
jgi:hypothetical protein